MVLLKFIELFFLFSVLSFTLYIRLITNATHPRNRIMLIPLRSFPTYYENADDGKRGKILEFIHFQLLTTRSAVLVVRSYCLERKSDNYFHSKRHDNSALQPSYLLPVDDVVFVPFRAFAPLLGGARMRTSRRHEKTAQAKVKR